MTTKMVMTNVTNDHLLVFSPHGFAKFFETQWQKSQYHNAVACGLAANSIRPSVHDIAATHTLPRCGTDFFSHREHNNRMEKNYKLRRDICAPQKSIDYFILS